MDYDTESKTDSRTSSRPEDTGANEVRAATGNSASLRYRLCPRCARAVPASSSEHYCVNDGTPLLESCPDPACDEPILSPYARFCAGCGRSLF